MSKCLCMCVCMYVCVCVCVYVSVCVLLYRLTRLVSERRAAHIAPNDRRDDGSDSSP
jgi:hypothetical protein